MKMAIRTAIVSQRRKDFGGERTLASWEEALGGPRGEKGKWRGWTGDQPRRSLQSVCLSSVCPLQEELVQAVLADCNKTFGGVQGHGQERLSPEPGQSVMVKARKGWEIQMLAVSTLKEGSCFGQYFADVWLPGGVPFNFVMPGGP